MRCPDKIHEFAELFPPMSEEEKQALTYSIREHGQQHPILVFENKILDGRHRKLACDALGLAPTWQLYEGEDALNFVIASNLDRRHLSTSQRAMLAAKIANMRVGRPEIVQNCTIKTTSLDSAAEKTHVSRRSVANAKKVLTEGTPELSKAVEAGTVEVNTAVQALELDTADQRKVAESENPKAEVKRLKRENNNAAIVVKIEKIEADLGVQQYGVILADPPWSFAVRSEAGKDRAAENHYPTMSREEIQDLKVADAAANDCVLLLWATAPNLLDALAVMTSWGFEYKSSAVWVKPRIGTGYWFRNRHELLLLGTCGNVSAPAPGQQISSVIEAPTSKHSEKPPAIHEMIEALWPNLPRIELFAREARADWDQWGGEMDSP